MKIPKNLFLGACAVWMILNTSLALGQKVDRRQFQVPHLIETESVHQTLETLYGSTTSPVTLFCGCPFQVSKKVGVSQCPHLKPARSHGILQWSFAMPLQVLAKGKRSAGLNANDLHNRFPALDNFATCVGTPELPTDALRKDARGDLARAWFYISVLYGVAIPEALEDRLRMWHLFDPPSEWEEQRNTLIEKVQGNRNPFIDHPALVERVPNF